MSEPIFPGHWNNDPRLPSPLNSGKHNTVYEITVNTDPKMRTIEWTEKEAVILKELHGIRAAIQDLQDRFPFTVRCKECGQVDHHHLWSCPKMQDSPTHTHKCFACGHDVVTRMGVGPEQRASDPTVICTDENGNIPGSVKVRRTQERRT